MAEKDSEINKKIDEIFKPIVINKNGTPIRAYTIFIDTPLPDFLWNSEPNITGYNLIRPDKSMVNDEKQPFSDKTRVDLREEFIKLGYEWIPCTKKGTQIPVKEILGVKVEIRNLDWGKRYSIGIKHTQTEELLSETRKVIGFLIEKDIKINRESICHVYCGKQIKSDDDAKAKAKNHKR